MSLRRVVLIALALGAAALPGEASAQAIFIGFDAGESPVSLTQANLHVTGAVTVDFHGDEASGCAAAGLCGVDGSVTWNPTRTGTLLAFGFRDHGIRVEDGYLAFGEDSSDGGPAPASFSRVLRSTGDGAPPSLCADLGANQLDLFSLGPRRRTTVALGVLGSGGFGAQPPGALRTRCAGPMATDVAGLLPTRLITEGALRAGPHRFDFSAERDFAAGGLAGTVHSTVSIRSERGQAADLGGDETSGTTREVRIRALEVSYDIDEVSGQVVTGVRGLADPDLCGPLDACGLLGSVTVAPKASSGEAYVVAQSSIRHSWRELRRAVGLAPGGRPAGVSTYGYASWGTDRGTVTSALTRDGSPACTDSEPLLAGGSLSMRFSSSGVRTAYGGADTAGELLATRCPGPVLGDVTSGGALATGTVALRALGARRVTLRLRHGRAYRGDGYSGATRPNLTVVMRRTKVKRRVQVFHVPEEFARVLARVRR